MSGDALRFWSTLRWFAWILVLSAGAGLPGCHERSSGDPPSLYLVSFHEEGLDGVYRDGGLALEFSVPLDPASVDADTIQVYTSGDREPVFGVYRVEGNLVFFNPVVDENTPGRGSTPLNPFGFPGNAELRVFIPASPTDMKRLVSQWGHAVIEEYTGRFSTRDEFVGDPAAPAPHFLPFAPAVFDTTHPPPCPTCSVGTEDPHDDLLAYVPVPDLKDPPRHPVTGQPDYRAGHPTDVQVQFTFSEVIHPGTIDTRPAGNLVLQFQSPTSAEWIPIPATASTSPDGRTVVLTAAMPLAHADRVNAYRVALDTVVAPIKSRAGKALDAVVVKWDQTQQAEVRAPVTWEDLAFWTRKQEGESGPLLTAEFPLDPLVKESTGSDQDVVFEIDRILAGPVLQRTATDNTPCTQAWCVNALREPFTQSVTSPIPNPNSKGASKVMFHYNSYQHAPEQPPYQLANAEALIGMSWGPLCSTVIKSTYPRLHIHVMWSNRNSTQPANPAPLPSTTYNSNFDVSPPGFAVRDGTEPYRIESSSNQATWYPWKFDRPFTDYRADKGLVWMAWAEDGGDVEQYPLWYSPSNAPMTRVFSSPSTEINPPVGQMGQYTYYWTQFHFKRMRSVAVTRYYRLGGGDGDRPSWYVSVVSPTAANLPGGTACWVAYSGARFASYRARKVGDRMVWEGVGTPLESTAFSTRLQDANGYPALALRVYFEANVDRPEALPFVNGVSFTYRL